MMSPAAKAAFIKRMQGSKGMSLNPARTPAVNVPQGMMSAGKTATRVGNGATKPNC